ncbi:unnamed protein product [Rotaria sp. Silwood1]|nr:unnamed protein product [Rotaria sp. Silwood1]
MLKQNAVLESSGTSNSHPIEIIPAPLPPRIDKLDLSPAKHPRIESAPGFFGYTAAAYGQEAWGASAGLVAGGGAEVADADLALGDGYSSSPFESSGFTTSGAEAGCGAGYGASSWGASGYSIGAAGGVDAAFVAADTNRNGTLDQGEFRQFLAQNL